MEKCFVLFRTTICNVDTVFACLVVVRLMAEPVDFKPFFGVAMVSIACLNVSTLYDMKDICNFQAISVDCSGTDKRANLTSID